MAKEENRMEMKEATNLAEAVKANDCNDRNCNIHGSLKTRGRMFEGTVVKKFPKRIVIEFERRVYVRKYERYAKKKGRMHARLPLCMESEINLGDRIRIRECRPLSKIVHSAVIEKINSGVNLK